VADQAALRGNLEAVQMRIAAAATRSGRNAQDIALVVVTKGHPASTIRELYDLGVRTIGESYVEEALRKQEELADLSDLQWDMIGHVQSRKGEDVARSFALVHAVDSLKLARRLDRFSAQAGRRLPILLEFNVSQEASKYGFPLSDMDLAPASADIEEILQLPNLQVRGLMCMAPVVDNPEKAHPIFAKARQVRDKLATRYPSSEWSQLSMGMSDDFEAAILEGATIVRVGTAIVGPRPANRRMHDRRY
jgi:pyridoxal phosphate enzyme (YggS family)